MDYDALEVDNVLFSKQVVFTSFDDEEGEGVGAKVYHYGGAEPPPQSMHWYVSRQVRSEVKTLKAASLISLFFVDVHMSFIT